MASSRWRLEAAKLRLWPDKPPVHVRPYSHGWVHAGNEKLLRRLLRERQPRVIVECGAWLGLCTGLLLEASEHFGAAVICVDKWDSSWLLENQQDQYVRDTEAFQLLQSGIDLHGTFLVNLWEARSRLFPLRMQIAEGLELIRNLGAPVDLIYVRGILKLRTHKYQTMSLSCADTCVGCVSV